MFNLLEENQIELTKGDSASLEVALITGSGEPYTMLSGDTLTLTIRKNLQESPVLTITSHTNVLDFTPIKTKQLPIGEAFYDIQLSTATGDIFTVVGVDRNDTPNWYTLEEVTH